MNFNISGYQVVKNNEDNKTTPTTLPYVTYTSGQKNSGEINYQNYYKEQYQRCLK